MENPLQLVRETAAEAARRADDVEISLSPESVELLLPLFNKPRHWLTAVPFDLSAIPLSESLPLIFMFHALGFSFWGEPLWTVDYRHHSFSRSAALFAALFRARDEGYPIHRFDFWAAITEQEFAAIVRPRQSLPLFAERLDIARETGSALSSLFNGDLNCLLEEARFDAPSLVALLAKNFDSLRDVSAHDGKPVYFLKRAQLIAADMDFLLRSSSQHGCSRTDELSVCADYRLPQVLRHFGILRYSAQLSERIDAGIEIAHGSPPEVEIRACTVTAIEQLHKVLRILDLTVHGMSDMIWAASQTAPGLLPFHRSRCIYY